MGTELEKILDHLRAVKEQLDLIHERSASLGLTVENYDIYNLTSELENHIVELEELDDFEFVRLDGNDDFDDDTTLYNDPDVDWED